MLTDADFIQSIATPSLVVDYAAAERNIEIAAAFFRDRTVKLRPHFKAHKTTKLLRMQVDAGGCSGVTCATAHEAEILAKNGFDNILVANQVVDAAALGALARAAAIKSVTAVIDCAEHIGLLESTAVANSVEFGVLVELDIGMGRCGLPFEASALPRLASMLRESRKLNFLGLQGYEGHAVLHESRETRKALVWQCQQQLKHERERLARHGISCEVVSGGGTGTFDFAAECGTLTEVQAGSYVLMDDVYSRIGLPFENAVFCCASLISHRPPDGGVLNAGLKTLSGESGMPTAANRDYSVLSLSDEHARIRFHNGFNAAIGQNTLLIPAHLDPTMNLHEVVVVYREPAEVLHWPVDGRHRPSHRLRPS